MITIDGSHGEGGGQILRTALALSMLTQKPFRIKNIRKNRPRPGLKAQHLTGIKALLEISKSEAIGTEIGSRELEFRPSPIEKFKAAIDVGTAGPITLVLQSILVPLMFAKKESRLKLTGGTDVLWSPTTDYFIQVITPQLKKFCDVRIKTEKRGYFPKGGGKVDVHVKPKHKISDSLTLKDLKKANLPFDLAAQGRLLQVKGASYANKEIIKSEVSERQARAAKIRLNRLNAPVSITSSYSEALCIGTGITLWACFGKHDEIDPANPVILGSDALGEKGKKAEIVGEEAAKKLLEEIRSGAAADSHLADNLIPLLGIFGGKIKTSELTGHIRSNIHVTEKFLDAKFELDEKNMVISTK